MDPDLLEQIAAQLAGRVRDDDPEANARWLTAALPDPADWFRLCFALAAAVPDDRTWSQLVAWTEDQPAPRAKVLHPHGTQAAAQRHRYYKERMCDACRAWDNTRQREKRARRNPYVATELEGVA